MEPIHRCKKIAPRDATHDIALAVAGQVFDWRFTVYPA
jgi:hypothetical protein